MAQVSLAMALDITGQHWEIESRVMTQVAQLVAQEANNSTAQAVTLQDLQGLEGRVMTQVAQHVAQEARKSTAQAVTLLDLQELEGRVLTQVAQAKPSEVAGQHLEALVSRVMPVLEELASRVMAQRMLR